MLSAVLSISIMNCYKLIFPLQLNVFFSSLLFLFCFIFSCWLNKILLVHLGGPSEDQLPFISLTLSFALIERRRQLLQYNTFSKKKKKKKSKIFTSRFYNSLNCIKLVETVNFNFNTIKWPNKKSRIRRRAVKRRDVENETLKKTT